MPTACHIASIVAQGIKFNLPGFIGALIHGAVIREICRHIISLDRAIQSEFPDGIVESRASKTGSKRELKMALPKGP